jgi:hypothetical protein
MVAVSSMVVDLEVDEPLYTSMQPQLLPMPLTTVVELDVADVAIRDDRTLHDILTKAQVIPATNDAFVDSQFFSDSDAYFG